jgi:hypothetical protein
MYKKEVMNTNFKPLQDINCVSGSSFYQDVIFATPNQLRYILGEPAYEQNDGTDKVNMEWYMEMNDSNIFTVYDYKEYRSLHPNEQIEWHIGGHDQFTTHLAKQLLSEALQETTDEGLLDD